MPVSGEWFVADFPVQHLTGAIREARSVTTTTVMTINGTTIPLSQVQGTVRRVIRFVP